MNLLAYWVHNLNPIIFNFGFFAPRWYGVAYLLGFLFAYILIKKLNRDGMLRLNPERVPDLVLNCCIFGVLIGGRLGFVFFYDLPISLEAHVTPLLWHFTGVFPYWGVLRVNDGGMSAHGGIIFTILTLMIFGWRQQDPKLGRWPTVKLVIGTFISGTLGWLLGYFLFKDLGISVALSLAIGLGWMTFYGWRKSINVVNIGDAACMVVPIGLCFGRIANFINGELYGHPTSVPWAVKFPSEIYSPTNGRIIDSVYDQLPSIYNKLGLFPDVTARDPFGAPLKVLSDMLAARNPEALRAVADILPPRHPSQLYEAGLEGVALFIICWTIGRVWRKDGMASGAFLTLYPVMRIIGEQFRVGDTPANIMGIEISKGVLYSIPMAIAGGLYWAYWIRRNRRIPWVPITAAGPEGSKTEPTPKAT